VEDEKSHGKKEDNQRCDGNYSLALGQTQRIYTNELIAIHKPLKMLMFHPQ